MDFSNYHIDKTPIITTNSTLFKIYNQSEHLLIKIAYSEKSDCIDTFDLEYIASLVIKKLNIDFIKGIESIIELTSTQIYYTFDYVLPDGTYKAAIIKEIKHKSLHQIYTELKKNKISIFDSTYSISLFIFIEKLIQFGWNYGFVHNDLHTGNIIYDLDTEQFVIIDLGRAYFYNYHLFTQDELSSIYTLLNNESIPIYNLNYYYSIIKDKLTFHVRTVEQKYINHVYLFILFDIIGLLYYLHYFQIPDDIYSELNQLFDTPISTEKICVIWFYSYILSLQKFYKDDFSLSQHINDNWYCTLPLNQNNHTHNYFIKKFYYFVHPIKSLIPMTFLN